MCELPRIEVLFDRWLKADMRVHKPLDDSEKRRMFGVFSEAFFWAWTQDITAFQRWLEEKADPDWFCSNIRLVPGTGITFLPCRSSLSW